MRGLYEEMRKSGLKTETKSRYIQLFCEFYRQFCLQLREVYNIIYYYGEMWLMIMITTVTAIMVEVVMMINEMI